MIEKGTTVFVDQNHVTRQTVKYDPDHHTWELDDGTHVALYRLRSVPEANRLAESVVIETQRRRRDADNAYREAVAFAEVTRKALKDAHGKS